MIQYVIAALYQFKDFPDYKQQQEPLRLFCQENKVKGTLLLASEGINGTISGSQHAMDAVKHYLETKLGFTAMEYKRSFQDGGKSPFDKLKIKLKKEIVTLGVPGINPNSEVGTYVLPEEWNELIQDPDVILIDTRNHYEYKIGSFKTAVDPLTDRFRQFPDWVDNNLNPGKHKKVAMFCTGGIRCEKATGLMLSKGFKEVYHLKGGILKYLESIPKEQSQWEGECFVFDNRVSVNHELAPGEHKVCFGCGEPITKAEIASDKYEEGISCPKCFDSITEDQRKSRIMRNTHRTQMQAG